MLKRVITASGVVCFALLSFTFAQTSNATLGGTVSDATGALIPGVMITATNTATGIVTTLISNEAGAYQFASLQTGVYKVSAELSGFQTQTYSNVALGISQQVRLNFTLPVGGVAQSLEVTVAADTVLATSSSSIGSVLTDNTVRDLPLSGRQVVDLVRTTAGAVGSNFVGGRVGWVNTTRDGFVVGDGRYTRGAYSVNFVSPDLVEEVRIVTASVDAESLRGAGQVQMVTRSGTNQFRGSLFWNNRNTALDAAEWFNNFNNVEKNYENRTQAGARIGGPIVKNKTFFFALIDTQRDIVRETFVGTVLTAQARQGIFRFFPGVDNQNINQNNPTVDRNGDPVRPSNATGDLQSFSVFGRDPSRPGYDPTGFVQNTLLSRMPLPNDFTVGDGLNTAGIRFTRRINGQDDGAGSNIEENNRDQINTRIDHNFNPRHKLSFVYTYERTSNMTSQAGIMNWPNGYNGAVKRFPSHLTFSLVSTLSTNLVNELRVGRRNSLLDNWAPWYVGRHGEGEVTDPTAKEAFKLLPVNNGIPFQPVTTLFPSNILNWNAGDGGTRGAESPLWSYADTLAWTQGKHALKAGAEFRYMRSAPWNDSNFTPQAVFGAGGVQVTGIDNAAIPGL